MADREADFLEKEEGRQGRVVEVWRMRGRMLEEREAKQEDENRGLG